MQWLADRVSYWFVLVVLAIAGATFVVWGLLGPEPSWTYAVVNAVAVLIIACPCALGLATPMSVVVAMGRGAQSGVLLRDAEAIEKLRTVYTLIVDETGTLTEGKPAFRCVVAAARKRKIPVSNAESFEPGTGLGMRGEVDGRALALGSAALMRDAGIGMEPMAADAEKLRHEGASVMFLAADTALARLIAVAVPVKATMAEALGMLRHSGLRIVMATGDAAATAQAVAAETGIGEVHGEVRPSDKTELVSRLHAEGRSVAMADDGIDDAPALAAADVGIAMGTGTDVAISGAKVTLVKGDLRGIACAR